MGLLKLFITALFILGFQCFGWSQITVDQIQIWFEESIESDAISITTNFLSEAEDLEVLSYKISITFEEKGLLKILDIEKGEFLAAQNLPIPLSTKTIGKGLKDKISLSVEILQGLQSLVIENFVWEKEKFINSKANIAEVEIQKKVDLSLPKEVKDQKSNDHSLPSNDRANIKVRRKVDFTDALEIQGLIIDETRSKIGRDFYEIFFRKWIPPKGSKGDFTITIKELPSFGRSTRVALEVNSQSLGARNLSPRLEYVELQVNASIRQIRNYLTTRSKISTDLENEDASGSGIF